MATRILVCEVIWQQWKKIIGKKYCCLSNRKTCWDLIIKLLSLRGYKGKKSWIPLKLSCQQTVNFEAWEQVPKQNRSSPVLDSFFQRLSRTKNFFCLAVLQRSRPSMRYSKWHFSEGKLDARTCYGWRKWPMQFIVSSQNVPKLRLAFTLSDLTAYSGG